MSAREIFGSVQMTALAVVLAQQRAGAQYETLGMLLLLAGGATGGHSSPWLEGCAVGGCVGVGLVHRSG